MSETPPETPPEPVPASPEPVPVPPEPVSVPPAEPVQSAEPVRPPRAAVPATAFALPWWVPGLVTGLVVGAVVGAVALVATLSPSTHKATAIVQVRPALGEPALSEAERHNAAFLLRSRDLIARTLAVPEVSTLDTVKGHPDPVTELEQRLAVEVADSGVATVTLTGFAPDDLRVILDNLVRLFVDDFTSFHRKTRDERLQNLEKLSASLRQEIDLQEKAIELLARTNGTTGTGDPSGAGARLRDRLNQLESELAKDEAAVGLLEGQAQVLKRRQTAGAAPDPVELARLVDADARVALLISQRADATVALERERAGAPGAPTVRDLQGRLDRIERALAAVRETVRKEVAELLREADARRAERELADLDVRLAVAKSAREFDRRERDTIRKTLESGHVGGLNIESMRRSIGPQQEQLDRISVQIAQLRFGGSVGDHRASVIERSYVLPVRGTRRWGTVFGAAGMAFVAGFVLVTGFRLTDLVFRALEKNA